MSNEVFIGGHSLGGADAFLYAYSRVKRGLRVDGIYAFAPPKPGNHVIGSVLRTAVPAIVSVKNHRDLVTSVPPEADVFDEEYVQPVPFISINQPGTGFDLLFRDHHIALYRTGVYGLPANSHAVGINQAIDEVANLYNTADGWDWINPVDGLYWALRRFPNGAKLMIRRGSVTGRDWFVEDFDFRQRDWYGAKASVGFCAGIEPVQDQLDSVLV